MEKRNFLKKLTGYCQVAVSLLMIVASVVFVVSIAGEWQAWGVLLIPIVFIAIANALLLILAAKIGGIFPSSIENTYSEEERLRDDAKDVWRGFAMIGCHVVSIVSVFLAVFVRYEYLPSHNKFRISALICLFSLIFLVMTMIWMGKEKPTHTLRKVSISMVGVTVALSLLTVGVVTHFQMPGVAFKAFYNQYDAKLIDVKQVTIKQEFATMCEAEAQTVCRIIRSEEEQYEVFEHFPPVSYQDKMVIVFAYLSNADPYVLDGVTREGTQLHIKTVTTSYYPPDANREYFLQEVYTIVVVDLLEVDAATLNGK